MSRTSTPTKQQGAPTRVLVVDDEPALRTMIRTALEAKGYEVDEAEHGGVAKERLAARYYDAMLLDLRMPVEDGWAVLEHLRAMHDHPITLIMSAHGTIAAALDAVRKGAVDFIEKPFKVADLCYRLETALGGAKSQRRIAAKGAVAESAAMKRVFELCDRVAATPHSSALIFGESGAGKEIVATRIHESSSRAAGPFVRVNLAALPDAMVEAELFGSVKGAYTDSKKDRQGLLASADGGTILLDEIGEFRIDLQPKLLRVLEERKYFPVGSDKERPINVRVLAATNRKPEQAVAEGRLRADLFYRIGTVLIEVPPLRERDDDLLPLAEHFLQWFSAELGRGVMTLSPDAVMAIYAHGWPGNVRELRNVIERAVINCDGHSVTAGHLGLIKPEIAQGPQTIPAAAPIPTDIPAPRIVSMPPISLPPTLKLDAARQKALESVERRQIEKALQVARGNRTTAAELLGISRSTLWEKLKQYGMDRS